MQNTSDVYDEIVVGQNYWFEISMVIGDGAPDEGYREDEIVSLKTETSVFSDDTPTVGSAIAGELDLEMFEPNDDIPRMAKISLFVRATNGEKTSEWLSHGVYYVDTREVTKNDDSLNILTLHGYDAMMMFEQDYPSDTENDYPMKDIDMVNFLAASIGIEVDDRTTALMNKGYTYPLPTGYSSREMLGYIAGSYGGNFIISDENKLLLVALGNLPIDTNYLIDHSDDRILFGEYRILV